MATLAPSLRRLFGELDATWPRRDRRTDGWLRWPSQGRSVGHNPGHNNMVHAIDVDRDGIDPGWVVANIYRGREVMYYVIWNRTIWSNTRNFQPVRYTGSNPHTDHLHIEIYQTSQAEQWGGTWLGSSGIGEAPRGGGLLSPLGNVIGAAAEDARDPHRPMGAVAARAATAGDHMYATTLAIQQLRSL